MFFKKNTVKSTNEDEYLEKLLLETIKARKLLIEKVNQLIVSKGVIELYPEGPDILKAEKKFKKLQKDLTDLIKKYEGNIKKYCQYYEETIDKRVTTSEWQANPFSSSYEEIEEAYSDFYRLRKS